MQSEDTCREKAKKVCCAIWEVVKKILVALAAMILFYINPILFFVSFLAGVICSKQVDKILQKVEKVWKYTLPILIAVCVVAAFFVIEVPVAAAAVLVGAAIGSWLYKKADENQKISGDAGDIV